MNVSIFSTNTNIQKDIESYSNGINISQGSSISSFFQEMLFSNPDLLILDTTEKVILELYQKIKDEKQFENLNIIFFLDLFNLDFFKKIGFNIGDIDYLKKPIEINQLIFKLNCYKDSVKNKKQLINIETFINEYSQAVIKGEMLGIVSHQWKQPLNIIATSIINIEIKSELEQLRHCDIEQSVEKIHSTLERITTMIHSFENVFKKNLTKLDFNVNTAFKKAVDLMHPQLSSHKIKVMNNIPKMTHTTLNYENELCQCILCLLSIIKDSIIKKHNQIGEFDGKIILKMEKQGDRIILKIINQNIEMPNDLFENNLSLNSLFLSSIKNNNTKLYIAKKTIENKLNGNLNIINDSKDVIFTITI